MYFSPMAYEPNRNNEQFSLFPEKPPSKFIAFVQVFVIIFLLRLAMIAAEVKLISIPLLDDLVGWAINLTKHWVG